jgi:predicted small integral membrane protein
MEIAKELRDITKEQAIESYHDMKAASIQSPDFSRGGLKALDYFFMHHRIKAKTKRHISFYEAMHDPQIIKKLSELVVKYKKKSVSEYDRIGLLKAQYQVFQLYYGTINQFRPMIAKWVYHLLKPRIGILDFSAGWGGRMLAAMSMGIPYIGIDANKKLEASYRNMIKTYEPYADVRIIFKPSETVDVSQFKYDLVFTSPPYFMIEEYEKMPAYQSKQGFLDIFFIPVVMNVWKHLAPGGNMALNMPEEMYNAIKHILPKVKRQLLLPLSNRHPVNTAKGAKLGTEDKERHEIIYVWNKRRG